MKRISKDDYYLEIAHVVAERSTCLRRHYGAVVVNHDEIVATGYNGSARGDANCCDIYEECPRKHKAHNSGDYGDCPAVHAEQNALLSVSRKDTIGATLYLNGNEVVADSNESGYQKIPMSKCSPCPICERMIHNSGIVRVVGPQGTVFDLNN